MVYHSVTLGPSDGQMSDLASGRTILLNPGDMDGDVTFHLTTAQVNRIKKAYAAGRGCKLKLSAAQVKMMAQKGSGRFSDYLRQGYDFVKPTIRAGARAGLSAGRQLAEKKMSGALTAAEKRIAQAAGLEGSGFFSNLARRAAHGGIDIVADQLGGALPRPKKGVAVAQAGSGWLSNATFGMLGDGANMRPARPARAYQGGKGFFSNLARRAAHGGVDIIANQLGGAVPNPHANPNEALRGALFQKKVAVGSGLRQ